MKIMITSGQAWYKSRVGEIFDVYEVTDVGYMDNPEIGYTIDPIKPNTTLRYVSEFDCEVISQ